MATTKSKSSEPDPQPEPEQTPVQGDESPQQQAADAGEAKGEQGTTPDVIPANFEDIAALERPDDQKGAEDDPQAEQNTEESKGS